MDKIAAAQQSLANTPSTSPKGTSPLGASPSGNSPNGASPGGNSPNGANPGGNSPTGFPANAQQSYAGHRQYNSPLRLQSSPSQLQQLIGDPSSTTSNPEHALGDAQHSASHQDMLQHFQQRQLQSGQVQLQEPRQGQVERPQGSLQGTNQQGTPEEPLADAGAQPEGPQHVSNPGSQAASLLNTKQRLGAEGSSLTSVQRQR